MTKLATVLVLISNSLMVSGCCVPSLEQVNEYAAYQGMEDGHADALACRMQPTENQLAFFPDLPNHWPTNEDTEAIYSGTWTEAYETWWPEFCE